MNLQDSKQAAIAYVKAQAEACGYECDLDQFMLDVMLGLYVEGEYPHETIVQRMNPSVCTHNAFYRTINS